MHDSFHCLPIQDFANFVTWGYWTIQWVWWDKFNRQQMLLHMNASTCIKSTAIFFLSSVSLYLYTVFATVLEQVVKYSSFFYMYIFPSVTELSTVRPARYFPPPSFLSLSDKEGVGGLGYQLTTLPRRHRPPNPFHLSARALHPRTCARSAHQITNVSSFAFSSMLNIFAHCSI
jgi:hypothetical protein